jgi:segregation and condensation protein B
MTETDANPELKNIVEAALLVAGEPVTIERLLALFPEQDGDRPTRDDIRAALAALERDYAARGIEIRQIDKGYRIQTRARYSAWIERLTEERPPRYSRALLETLAIIAYRQPVTRGDIEEIRGVAVSTEIIKTLLGREWVREVGRREVPGRPALYGTTREFLEHFNIKSLEELPTLAELRPIEQIGAELDRRLAQAAGVAEVSLDVTTGEGTATGEGGEAAGEESAARPGAEARAPEVAQAVEARPAGPE